MNPILTGLISKKLGVAATGLILIYMMDREPTSSTPFMGAIIGVVSVIYLITQALVDIKLKTDSESKANETENTK